MGQWFDHNCLLRDFRFRNAKFRYLLACCPETRLQNKSHSDKSTYLSKIYSHTITQCTSFLWHWTHTYQHRVFFHWANFPKIHPCWDKCTFLRPVSGHSPIDHSTHSCQNTPIVQYRAYDWQRINLCKRRRSNKCIFLDLIFCHLRKSPHTLIRWDM